MEVDRNSNTWKAVESLIEREEAEAIRALRSRKTSNDDTQFFRGVLDLVEKLKSIEQSDVLAKLDTGPGYQL